jgi:hypothetical protein
MVFSSYSEILDIFTLADWFRIIAWSQIVRESCSMEPMATYKCLQAARLFPDIARIAPSFCALSGDPWV